ncbi:hypothetical protein GGQ22_08445 [Nocardioides sp. zg-579]|uniref:Uncharacterized protein n=1 Tax=Nocardioides marmotae TaxID=2663857 RepID=A0A6I3J3C0_9ACTN|nr:hypothetical protein [Nocardioides marmotae]MCR6031477.1 hypothetical protein [Gordonia jinghuaiqii]MTB95116.1 hypothetical protein [Nocardioides marmotae]QKE02396.1 hypothetical protein HPC71_15960 [Nocardioides marmotae]
MASRVVLHVGLMKSGTSYLQQRLGANRALLRERGVLFPGGTWRDQVLAVSDVLERKQAGPAARGRWASLVAEAAAYDGVVVVSMEFLGPAPPAKVAEVVSSFGDTPVEVVLTLRDLGRGVPAMWQESLQNGGTTDWAAYVAGLAGKRRPARAFWRQQGMGRIVGNWAAVVGPGRTTVVTVPPPGAPSGLLWERFCRAAGIDGDGAEPVSPANTSLDAASALVLLDLNRRLEAAELSAADYHTLVKFGLAKRVMAGRGGAAIGFAPPPWLVERSAEVVKRVAAAGTRVVGDLADLEPVAVAGIDPADLPAEERLAAAVDVLAGLTVQRADRRRAGDPGTTVRA